MTGRHEVSRRGLFGAALVAAAGGGAFAWWSGTRAHPGPGADANATEGTGPTGDRLGFAVPFAQLKAASPREIDEGLRAAAECGARWVRVDIPWDHVEAVRGGRDWAANDMVLGRIAAAGFRVLAILDYAPRWATAQPVGDVPWTHGAPEQRFRGEWRRFVADAVDRYGHVVSHWEIGNEVNLDVIWGPAADPAGYTGFLVDAYAEIKARQPGDASTVLTAGTATTERAQGIPTLDFVRGIYAAGGGGHFDGVALHPYTYPHDVTDAGIPAWARHQVVQAYEVRELMKERGDGAKAVWITEIGFPTSATGEHPAVDEQSQARLLERALTWAFSLNWTGPVFVFTLQDTVIPDSAGAELRFGLRDLTGRPRPAFDAVRRVVSGS